MADIQDGGEPVEYVGSGGRGAGARYFASAHPGASPGPALVWAGRLGSEGARLLVASARAAGIAVLAVDGFAAEATTPDREAVSDLEAALAHLESRADVDGERLALAGAALGGTRTLLAACTSRRVAASVLLAAPVVHAELSRERPAQPLELVANLSSPLLAVFGSADPATPPGHLQAFERALGPWMKSYELDVLEGAGPGFLDPDSSGYHPPTADAVRERIVRFLRECLELP